MGTVRHPDTGTLIDIVGSLSEAEVLQIVGPGAGIERKPPPWIERRRTLCDACHVEPVKCEVAYKRALQATRQKGCKKGCWFARFVARAESACPQGRWEKWAMGGYSQTRESHLGALPAPKMQDAPDEAQAQSAQGGRAKERGYYPEDGNAQAPPHGPRSLVGRKNHEVFPGARGGLPREDKHNGNAEEKDYGGDLQQSVTHGRTP